MKIKIRGEQVPTEETLEVWLEPAGNGEVSLKGKFSFDEYNRSLAFLSPKGKRFYIFTDLHDKWFTVENCNGKIHF